MMRRLALKGMVAGLKQSVIFVFFGFLLTRPISWCRTLGALVTVVWSCYIASTGFLAWQNSINVLFSLLYLAASYKRQKPLRSLESYIKGQSNYSKLC